jgi:hypothetical protein
MRLSTALLIRLYPRAWQRRYGDEVCAHVGSTVSARDAINLAAGAVRERMRSGMVLRPVLEGGGLLLLPGLVSSADRHDPSLLAFSIAVALMTMTVTLLPAAVLAAYVPRVGRTLVGLAGAAVAAFAAYRIGSHVSWIVNPVQVALVAAWVGFRAARRAQDARRRQIA